MAIYDYLIHLPNKIFFPFFKIDKKIYNDFQKTCCLHIGEENITIDLCRYIIDNLNNNKINDIINVKIKDNPKCYSINIFNELDQELKEKIAEFFKNNERIKKVSSMLGYKSKFRGVSLLVNFQNENTKEIEGAKMFHRDSDSLQDQIKLFILVKDINEKCGNFYYVPKNFINDAYRLPFEEDRKRLGLRDKWRNYDDTLKSALKKFKINPENAIKKLNGKQGEAIYIDTGKVYHKGGFVSDKNNYRILLQAVYTPCMSLSNWNKSKNKFYKYLQNKLTNLRIKLRKEIKI